MLSHQQIASLLGVPESRVAAYWPLIDACLAAVCDNYTDAVRIAALATIRVECPPFMPIHEYGTDALHEKLYGGRKDLGNSHPGDGARYAGRGFIQITGEANYGEYGRLLGVDLIDDPADPNDDRDPDKALDGNVSAAIFSAYFHQRGCDIAANAYNWTRVREKVNGGHNQLLEFLHYVQQLCTAAGYVNMAAIAETQREIASNKKAQAAKA